LNRGDNPVDTEMQPSQLESQNGLELVFQSPS